MAVKKEFEFTFLNYYFFEAYSTTTFQKFDRVDDSDINKM